MKHPIILVPFLGALAAGCASGSGGRGLGTPTSLEVRSAQSRVFESADARLVLKAAANALQDAGFVIREADADLGLVTASAEWQSRRPNQGLRILKWAAVPFTYGASLLVPSGRSEFSNVLANVNVTQEPGRVRARVSLVAKVTDKSGRVLSVEPIVDPTAYAGLLAALDRAVYLEREGL
jgi:hypothetical protein